MKKGIKKKFIICVCLALVFSCAFALPCFAAKQWSVIPNYIGTWTASYTLDNPIHPEEGTVTLTYESQRTVSTAVYYVFKDAPFNYGGIDSDSDGVKEGYRVDVTMRNIPLNKLDTSDNDYWVRFRFAIGARNQIYGMPNTTYVELLGSDGQVQKYLKNKIEGNICYVEDTFKHIASGALNIRISFEFGTVASNMAWSDSTHFWITEIFYGRNTDISDVDQSIKDGIDDILNLDDEHSVSSNENLNSFTEQMQDKEDSILDNFDAIYNQIPDIKNNSKLIAQLGTVGTVCLAVFNGFGNKFIDVWWVLVSIGILGTFIGMLIKGGKKD